MSEPGRGRGGASRPRGRGGRRGGGPRKDNAGSTGVANGSHGQAQSDAPLAARLSAPAPSASMNTPAEAAAPVASGGGSGPDFSPHTFESLRGVVDDTLLDTIRDDLGFRQMTTVQAACIGPMITEGRDVLAQARTGSGKTFTFLIPAVQRMLSMSRSLGGGGGRGGKKVSCLIITPTRELALQIETEANALLKRLARTTVRHAIGGTNKNTEERQLVSGCDILVATPGRLLDHLSEPAVKETLSNVQSFVLDEADRLLDMGFLPDLKKIVAHLPDRARVPRQGMLFSATIADHVRQVAGLVLSPGYTFTSTIPQGEAGTHEKVPQTLISVPAFEDVAPALVEVVRTELAAARQTGSEFKAIVFAQTAAMADWYTAILGAVGGVDVPCSVLHSRLSQSKRTSITNDFAKSQTALIVATDVIARGMDFPNVTHVFQAGAPMDRESYIHRLGRTARAGKDGRGHLLIADVERFFPEKLLKDVPLKPASVNIDAQLRSAVDNAARKYGNFEKTYQAWLGYYKGFANKLKWSPAELVAVANDFATKALQAPEVPALLKKTVGKMGLKGVPGLRLRTDDGPSSGGGGGGRNGGAGGAQRGGAGRGSQFDSGTSTPVRKVPGGDGRIYHDQGAGAGFGGGNGFGNGYGGGFGNGPSAGFDNAAGGAGRDRAQRRPRQGAPKRQGEPMGY